MNFDVLWRYAPSLVSGFGVTVLCWGFGAALGLVIGLFVALCYEVRFPPLRWLLRVYIEVLRGTPFLMQLFLLYAGGPYIGLRLNATAAGIVGLALYSSSYFAEIFRARVRGGAGRTDRGGDQRRHDAAGDAGLVRLPGALIAATPPIVNTLIVMSKETVVLSIITVPELMYQMQTMAAETFTAFDAIFAMAAFYWLLVEVTSRARALVRTARHPVPERVRHERPDDRNQGGGQEFRRAPGAARRRPRLLRAPRLSV